MARFQVELTGLMPLIMHYNNLEARDAPRPAGGKAGDGSRGDGSRGTGATSRLMRSSSSDSSIAAVAYRRQSSGSLRW